MSSREGVACSQRVVVVMVVGDKVKIISLKIKLCPLPEYQLFFLGTEIICERTSPLTVVEIARGLCWMAVF